ncbi:MAG TPA: type IV secretory system conjugative DNA transfer family protein [Stellaceae bacterium]|nr:type IV secretory system conjugative DNA transfer family protein [Stellaceae bacterium]
MITLTPLMQAGLTGGAGLVALGALAFKSGGRRRPKKNADIHGSAGFMSAAEVRRTGLLASTAGVYLGAWPGRFGGAQYLRDDSSDHVITIAPTRSGKGIGVIVPSLLSWPDSALVYDEKRELWEMTAGWRAKHADNLVYRWEPAASTGSAGFNFLDEVRLDTEHDVADAQNIAQCLIDYQGHGIDALDHWQKTSMGLLAGTILHVLYREKAAGRGASLGDVAADLSGNNGSTADLWTAMRDNLHSGTDPHPFIAGAGLSQLERADRERASVLSTLNTYLMLFTDPVVDRNTNHSDFALHDLADHDKPVSVYIVTPGSDKERLRPLVRLFISMAMRNLMSAELKFRDGRPLPAHKHRLLFMLDEMPSLGRMELVEGMLARGAGYGIKAMIVCQAHEQLTAIYGPSQGVVANCRTRIIFAPNDEPTAKWVSDLCGQTTVFAEHITETGHRFGAVKNFTRTYQEVGRSLLTPDEVRRLKKPARDAAGNLTKPGELLILIGGERPIKAQQLFYFEDQEFLARANVAAP